MPKRRVNPRRRPATQADINRAKREATDFAVERLWSIMFTVLRDKEGYDLDGLRRVWQEVDDLADSISRGYCTVQDLKHILKEEEGAVITSV